MTAVEDRITITSQESEPVAGWVSDALADWTSEPDFHDVGGLDTVFLTECPEWCEDRPHEFEWGVEDRRHSGPTCRVPLTLENAQHCGGNYYQVEFAQAYLYQQWLDADPHIYFDKGGATGMKFTLDEAEQVAAMLTALVAVGRKAEDFAA